MGGRRGLPPPPPPSTPLPLEPPMQPERVWRMFLFWCSHFCLHPRRACAARVTVFVCVCVCVYVSVCVCLRLFPRYDKADDERYQRLQCYKRSKNKMAIFLKRPRSSSRNWLTNNLANPSISVVHAYWRCSIKHGRYKQLLAVYIVAQYRKFSN